MRLLVETRESVAFSWSTRAFELDLWFLNSMTGTHISCRLTPPWA